MLPTYEDTPLKNNDLAAGALRKKDASDYLCIKEDDLLAHVRQGRLSPRNPQADTWEFEIRELDRVARWYDGFRAIRRKISVVYLWAGLATIAIGAVGSFSAHGFGELVGRLLYCLGAGGLGLALRAHRLERENLSSPWPDYRVSFPFILGVNAFASVAALSYFEATRCVEGFVVAAFPLSVVLALFVHPDHWIIPQWLRQGKLPGA